MIKDLINGLLLIAPKGVYKNWYDSRDTSHLPDHIEKKVVLWKTSDKSKKQQQILKHNVLKQALSYLNYEC